jgi:hypothetical protein
MKSSANLPSEPVLEGEVLPPASAATATITELSPLEFLAQHGVRAPKPKAYNSLGEAMRAIITDVVKGEP